MGKLTDINGTPISYDQIGNPLNDGRWTYDWTTQGRQLASITAAGLEAAYAYTPAGTRVSKTVNGVTTAYMLDGSLILRETVTGGGNDYTLNYAYDSQGKLTSIGYKTGTAAEVFYFVERNAQGDIIALYNSADSTKVGEYVYDSWGKLVSTIPTNDPNGMLQKNPFRYRGYYYDTETGFFYVGARYYNPQTGRWLNADDGVDTGAGLIGTNLFAYCANNPVNNYDPTGEFIITITTCIVIGVIAGAAIGGGAGAYYSYKKFGKVKWKYVTGGVIAGGIIGGLVGWGAGAILAHFGVIASLSSITVGGGAGFETFQKLKDFLGSPGWGKQWHHIVEQCQEVKSGYSEFWINNSNNVINISEEVHQKISAYYSSI